MITVTMCDVTSAWKWLDDLKSAFAERLNFREKFFQSYSSTDFFAAFGFNTEYGTTTT